jgi:HlyD family secretion protein
MIKKTIEYIKIPKKVFYTVIALIIIALIAKALKPSVEEVDLATIEKGVFRKVIIDEAMTEFTNKKVLTAPADGITPSLDFNEGDAIKKGDVLISFTWDRIMQIKAPFDGYVLRIFEKDQRHVVRGTPLLEVGNSDELVVIAKILSEEVVDVKVGQKVFITKWGKEKPLEAKVIKIEKAAQEEISALGVKEQRVKVHMKILTERSVWRNLGDGFKVEVSIITEEIPDSLLLPVSSLFTIEGRTVIYIEEKGRSKVVLVEIGSQNREFALLKTPLKPGTKVVQYPGPNFHDGLRIKQR